MIKDFKKWHEKKAEVDQIDKRPFFHEREIWYCYLGLNVGFEQDGKGTDFIWPVLIIRKFNNEIFWCVPLIRTNKKTPYYFSFTFENKNISVAILSQIRLVDARRLGYRIGDMTEKEFELLKQKIKDLLP